MDHLPEELAELLRDGSYGDLPDEAAVELLIGHDTWLHRSDFVDACVRLAPDHTMAHIDWPVAVRALQAGEFPCSTSEASMLRIAAGLGGVAVALWELLGGLDSRNILLVAIAVLHANGTRSAPLP